MFKSPYKFSNFWLPLLINLTYVVIIVSHLWQLDTIPRGFYVDELSTGYNAITITNTGQDEFGHSFPLYFRSFGDYKQPIYIYTTALVFKLLGVSEFNLRLVSFIYFMLFIVSLHLIIRKLFPLNDALLLYALITAGFLPWYFTLSRIAFDVITQLAITTLAFFFILKTYHGPPDKQHLFNPMFAGGLLGLSIYSYTTSRFLSFLYLFLTLLVYARRTTLKRSLIFVSAFFILAAPFITYSWQHPGQLNAYVHQVVYIDDPIPLTEKLSTFTNYYFSYLSPSFLMFDGDSGNARHHSGYGGQLFVATYTLATIGILSIFSQPFTYRRFLFFLTVSLLLSPIAAAITIPYISPHALRSSMFGLFLLLISCWGFFYTVNVFTTSRYRLAALSLIFLALITQAYLYTRHYFTIYPEQSIKAFETYNFQAALAQAIKHNPTEIIIANYPQPFYVTYSFYKHLVPNPDNIPVKISAPIASPRTCVIFFVHFAPPPLTEPIPYQDFSHPANDTQLRCYQ